MVRFFHFMGSLRMSRRSFRSKGSLLRVKLDDELLVDGNRNRRARGHVQDAPAHLLDAQVQPLRHALSLARLERVQDDDQLAALLAQGHLVAGLDQERRDVHVLAVDAHVAVTHELARRRAVRREAEPIDDVVEARLEQLQQGLAGDALRRGGLGEIQTELTLEDSVDSARLLLLAELLPVVRLLGAAILAVLAGSVAPPLHRALVAEAALSL